MGKASKGKSSKLVPATATRVMGAGELAVSELHGASALNVSTQPSAHEAWKRFAYELYVSLGGLEEDEFLILSVKNRPFYYVQFAAQGSFGMRAEASSSFYIPEEAAMSEEQHKYLLDLGWRAPSKLPDDLQSRHEADGSASYFVDLAKPVPYDRLAVLAVNTLRNVFGTPHPGELQYRAFSNKTAIRFPNLGIKRADA